MIMLIAPLLLSAALGATARSNGNATGEFRGYDAVNAALKSRLLDDAASNGFALSAYFGDGSGDLAPLLGRFDGGEFRNGDPNALNMLLWYIGMSSFAGAVEKGVCVERSPQLPGTPWTLKPSVFEAFSAACALPDDPAARGEALLGVWLSTVSYDAPRAEFDAWAADLGAGAPKFADLLAGALLDPYLILEP